MCILPYHDFYVIYCIVFTKASNNCANSAKTLENVVFY